MKAIGYNITKAYEEGKLKDKPGLLSLLQTVSQNLCRKKKGKRYNATSKDFYEVLLTLGGPRLCDFVSSNLDAYGYGMAERERFLLCLGWPQRKYFVNCKFVQESQSKDGYSESGPIHQGGR